MKLGKALTFLALGFLVVNIGVTSLALGRYEERSKNIPPKTFVAEWLDKTFPDEKLRELYPTMTTMND